MLFSLLGMPDWSENHPDGEAKCRKFPLPNADEDPWFDDRSEAKDVCNGKSDGVVCPRREECLHMAMTNYEAYGIWGGTTEDERRWLRVSYPGQAYRWTHELLKEISE